MTPEILESLYIRIYDSFIMGVDGIDNGIEQYPTDVKPNYSDKTCLGLRINRLFPMWTEKNTDENICFMSAIEVADAELRSQVKVLLLSVYPAKEEVKKAVEARTTVHPSGSIVVLHTPVPWKDHLEELEKTMGLEK